MNTIGVDVYTDKPVPVDLVELGEDDVREGFCI